MNKSPAFQFYVKDFLTDDKVAVMNMEARGVYITLLSFCWNNNGLTNDQEELKEMCGNPANWDKIWKKVGKCFYEKSGKLFNKRLDKEREKQEYWKRKSKEGGIKSGKTRRDKAKTNHPSLKNEPPFIKKRTKHEPKGNHSVSSSSFPSSFPSSLNTNEDTKVSSPQSGNIKTPKIIFNFKHRKWEEITIEDKSGWLAAYPACDIDLELYKMREWLLANPDKRKKNYRRFIVNWLTRTQDKGGSEKIRRHTGGRPMTRKEQAKKDLDESEKKPLKKKD